MRRKICVITGSRAEYGLLRQIMRTVHMHSRLTLQVVVTGMHLSPLFGSTVAEIAKDGLTINAKVAMTPDEDSHGHMAKSIGKGIIGITDALCRLEPDIVIVLGDRVEALAGAIAAIYLNKVVAHIHGGDRTVGSLDKYARHAITKLSHIHFAASKESASRILRMNEEAWRVHTIGAPGLDEIYHTELQSKQQIAKKYKIDLKKPLILLVQHPVTTDIGKDEVQMKATLDALVKLGHQTVIVYPNADAGGRKMIEVIERSARAHPFLKTYPSIPREDYLSIMSMASVMVGNSSSGIIESPSFHLPVVNVGNRQEGRQRAANVIDVPYRKNAIVASIEKCLYDNRFLARVRRVKNPYGDGTAAEKIVTILANIPLDERLLTKVD